jgi:hypothetical protein
MMKKFISILLLLATLLSCFMGACGEPDDENNPENPEEPTHANEYVCIRETDDLVYRKVEDGGVTYLEFGMYPQSKVVDSEVLAGLSVYATELPTATDFKGWTSQEFANEYGIKDNLKEDWFFVKDVKYQGEYYRASYFTELRELNPGSVTINKDDGSGEKHGKWGTSQDKKGYTTGKVYWFKYEPIRWQILYDTYGEMFLMCSSAIDANYWDYDGLNISNRYDTSTMRTFLNDTFLYYAFTKAEREKILQATYYNDSNSNCGSSNTVCPDTFDKVALPSMADLTSWFENNITAGVLGNDPNRIRKSTDYANCQGNYNINNTDLYASHYWTRSAGPNSRTVVYVTSKGGSGNSSIASFVVGIVPVIYVQSIQQ